MEDELSVPMLRNVRRAYASALDAFLKSSSPFQILKTHPSSAGDATPAPKTLYVLDSSFNPPSLAHTRIALSALQHDPRGARPKRLMLLLSTHNADKEGSQPAPFEDRLVMMTLMASEITKRATATGFTQPGEGEDLLVDVALTKKPYFHDKAAAIDDSGIFPDPPQQIHLAGFDTLIRIFDTKYYPPDHTLTPLAPFLEEHRLRVVYRPDDGWGGRQQQEKYVQDFRDGKREQEGGKREWAGSIDMMEGKADGEETVSSTKARNAAKAGGAGLEKYVTPGVREWILSEGLYLSDRS